MDKSEANISFRIDEHTKEQLQKLADGERRSLANYCRITLEDHVKDKGKKKGRAGTF